MPLPKLHLTAAPFDVSLRGCFGAGSFVAGSLRACVVSDTGEERWHSEGVHLYLAGLREVGIAEGSQSLSEEACGLRRSVVCMRVTSGATVTSFVRVEAALHILAAWVASNETKSTAAERGADVEELEGCYHRAAKGQDTAQQGAGNSHVPGVCPPSPPPKSAMDGMTL